jgi:hypothetical protein
MSWVTAPDSFSFDGSQVIRVHFAQSCITNPGLDQVLQAIAAAGGPGGDNDISSVSDVSNDVSATVLNPFSLLTLFYVATVSPVPGAQAGQIRATIFNALTALASTAGINCNNFSVGTIEYNDGSSIMGSISGALSPSGSTKFTIGLVAVAVVAVVVLILIKR